MPQFFSFNEGKGGASAGARANKKVLKGVRYFPRKVGFLFGDQIEINLDCWVGKGKRGGLRSRCWKNGVRGHYFPTYFSVCSWIIDFFCAFCDIN